MPNLKFILSLEKDSLNQMRLELLKINSKKHVKAQDMSLSRVTFDEFCCAMLDLVGTKEGKSNTNLNTEELLSFIRIFSIFYDSVDVDSRGIIAFIDFSNFCLRVGRMQFKPSIKRSVTSYTQDLNFSPSFPIGKLCFIPQTRLLYTFDSDTPVVRIFRRDGRFVGRVNPVALLKRSLKLNAMTGSMTYHDKKQYGKEFLKAKNAERELNATKGTVLAMVYVDSTKQWMFSSSASYLIWFGTPAGGFKAEEDLTMISYVKCNHPQIGMIYSKALDLVLTWSGEGSDHMFEVWDPHHRALRLRIQRHDKKILSVCEVMLDPLHPLSSHFFASSCIDGKNLLWSTNPISALTHKSTKMLRVADPLVYELRGNHHATRSLIYAPDHELIVGAGFDFEVYVWDPHTRDIVMRLVGHFKPLFAVTLVFTPNEKVATIDVAGTIKVWNIDKEQGLFGEQIQTMQLQCPLPLTIFDFTAAFNGGSTIAVLAERLYMLSIEMESIENIRPVPKGLGFCEGNSRLWCITRNAINIANLSDGTVLKRVAFLDQDRVSSEDVIVNNIEHQQKLDDANVTEEEKLDKALNISTYKTSYIDQKDTITAVAMDALGKKLFLGSMDGRVFIFDTFTFGLLVQLTNEAEDPSFLNQGSVAGLYYVDRDELLIAAYSNGAVKVLVGCHRTNSQQSAQAIAQAAQAKPGLTDDGEIDYFSQKYPCSDGGKPPSRPFMLREIDLGIINDNSVNCVAFSEGFNVIAIGTKGSFVYIYDYINMELLSVLRIPKFDDKSVNLIEIVFVPNAPMLLAIDHIGRVTAWTVRPMKFKWINTWSSYYGITYDEGGSSSKWSTRGSMIGGGIQNTTSVSVPVNIQLTCFRAFGWTDPNAEPTAKPITPINTSFMAKPNPGHGVSFMRSNSVMVAESSIAEGSDAAASAFNEARLNFNSVTSQVIREAAEAAARSFEMSMSQLESSVMVAGGGDGRGASFSAGAAGGRNNKPMSQRSLRKMNSEKNLKNKIHQSSDQYWTILIGDESGNVMCQNITRLVEASGAAFQLPKTGKYPVYQRMKQKKRNTASNSETIQRPPLTPDVQNMIAHPVGDFTKQELVTHSRMQNAGKYVTGVRKWIAFQGDPIRVIVPVDNTVYEKYKDSGLFPELSLSNFSNGTATAAAATSTVPSVSTAKGVSNRTPAAVFTVSEYGAVRLWSWEGHFLGQLKEEELSLHQQALKLAEQPKKKEEVVEEDSSFTDNATSATFVTRVITVEPPKEEENKPAFHSAHPELALLQFQPSVSLKNVPKARRVSVVRKSMIGGGSQKSNEITTRDMSALVLGINQSFVSCDISQEGWSFPSVTMKTFDNYTSDATAVQQAESRISRYTLNQFNFFSCIMGWVLPFINRYVDRLNEEYRLAELAASASSSNFQSSLFITQSSVSWGGGSPTNNRSSSPSKLKGEARPFSSDDVEGDVPFSGSIVPFSNNSRPASANPSSAATGAAVVAGEKNKFGSTANLLQGLNSFLVRKNTLMADDIHRPPSPIQPPADHIHRVKSPVDRVKSPTPAATSVEDAPVGSPLKPKASRKTINFANGVTSPTPEGTAAAAATTATTASKGKAEKTTINTALSASFKSIGSPTKHEQSHQHHSHHHSAGYSPEKDNTRAAEMEHDVQEGAYLKSLSEINITNELEEKALRKKRDKQNLVGLIDYIQRSDFFTGELKNNASSSQTFKNMEAVNFSKRKDKILLDIFEDPAFADLKPQIHNTEQYLSRSKIPRKTVEHQMRRSSAVTVPSLKPTSEAEDDSSSPVMESRPASPGLWDRRASMARLTRPKSAHQIRTIVEKNNLDGQEPTAVAVKRIQRTQTKMENILGLFEAEAGDNDSDDQEDMNEEGVGDSAIDSRVHSPAPAASLTKSGGVSGGSGSGANVLTRPASAPTIRRSLGHSDSYDSSDFMELARMTAAEFAKTEAHHCQSQRVLEIANKFHETIKSESQGTKKFSLYDPLHELKQKRRLMAQRKVENHRKNQNEMKEYIDIKTHDFEGVVNVGKELELAQIKLNQKILEQDESTPKLYGPYSTSDIFGYMNLTFQLEHLNKQEIEKLEAHKYNVTNDYRDPFSGQQVYSSEYLLNNKLIASYPSILQAIQQLVDLNGTSTISESDLIIMIFQHAFIEAHTRIFLFVRVARMVYTLFQNAVPPREGLSGIKKKEDPANAAITAGNAAITTTATAAGTAASASLSPARFRPGTAGAAAMHPADESRRKSAVASRHVIHIGHRYVVKPHPKRGFRKWAIKNKDFRRFVNFFDQWTREGNDAMLVCELIDIMQSMVPKLELQYYRLLTSLGPMMNRIEYRVTTELSTEVVTRIFENIFEVKIVPG